MSFHLFYAVRQTSKCEAVWRTVSLNGSWMHQRDPWQQCPGTEAGHSGELNGEKKLEQTASWNTENLNGKLRRTRFFLFFHQPRSDFQTPIDSNLSQTVLWQCMKVIKIILFLLKKKIAVTCCFVMLLLENFSPHLKAATSGWGNQAKPWWRDLKRTSDLFYISGDSSLRWEVLAMPACLWPLLMLS